MADILPEWLAEDLRMNGPVLGAPIDTARLRPAPRSSADESFRRARKTGETPIVILTSDELHDAQGFAPIPANLQLPPEMSQTAAFAQVPDWLPLSKRTPHRRVNARKGGNQISATPEHPARSELKR
jgi:hypothetical protein